MPEPTPTSFSPWRRGATAQQRAAARRLGLVYVVFAVVFGIVGVLLLDGVLLWVLVGFVVLELVALAAPLLLLNRD